MGQMLNLIDKEIQSADVFVQANNLAGVEITGVDRFSISPVIASTVGVAKSFASTAVDTTADTITIVAHGFLTGEVGQFTTDDTLPTGLSLSTDYYVIKVDADTIKVASSLNNANSGTPVNITAQGSGNDTFTPVALATCSVKLQKSNNNSDWSDETAITGQDVVTVTITTTGQIWLEKTCPKAKFYRLAYAIAKGKLTVTTRMCGRGLT